MISDKKIMVVFRNFFRNKMVNLTAQSVKHFLPNAEFHCFTYYKQSIGEYGSQEPLHDWIQQYNIQTKYHGRSDVHDSQNVHGTSGAGHPDNGKFFAESFNDIHNYFKDYDGVVLCLCEDHFFTTGQTLREVVDENYGLCIGPVAVDEASAVYKDQDKEANACIMAFRPKQVAKWFPMREGPEAIEVLFANVLIKPLLEEGQVKMHKLTTRRWTDYCGDGLYTNSSEVMLQELIKAKIL